MPLANDIGPQRYVLNAPFAGISTVPPPFVLASMMALWIAAPLFVNPSPIAP